MIYNQDVKMDVSYSNGLNEIKRVLDDLTSVRLSELIYCRGLNYWTERTLNLEP